MYNKEEQIKSIDEYIKANKQDLTNKEIEYLENISNNIRQSQNDEELLKWNLMLVIFLNSEKLDKLLKRDKFFKQWMLLLKLLAILASIIYHYI
jgi:hypothetical protein